MTINSRIFLNFLEDIRTLLDEQDMGVQDLLAEAGINAEVHFEALPPEHPGERTRELVAVIMAGSVAAVSLTAAVAIITSAISKALERKAVRPRYVEYLEEKPVLDAQGNPVLDAQGKVQTIRVPVHTFVEPRNLSEETFTVELGLKQGIVVRMGTQPKS